MVTFIGKIAVLLVFFVTSIADIMDNNNVTVCSEVCERYPELLSPSSRLGYEDTQIIDIESRKFLESHLRFFPCPPPELSTSFCFDLVKQDRLRLSCSETTFILEVCLQQANENIIVYMITDCKKHLNCSRFKRLCSSEKYSAYCNRQAPSFTDITDYDKIHMNNTTGLVMVESESSDPDMYYGGPTNWHILWVLLILLYILVLVPCFLNFVIKRSIIDKLRHRCQRKRHKASKVKENCEDDEPPLIPEVNKEVSSPVGTANSTFVPSRPDSMTGSIGVDWDFPFIDETPAVSMVSLLIDERNKKS